MRHIILGTLASLAITACSGSNTPTVDSERAGPWDLKAQSSSIRYTTIKNNSTAESNNFTLFSGSVSNDGTAKIDIALNSLETNVDTRNERMKTIVFNTLDHPSAVITSSLPMSELTDLTAHERKRVESEVSVTLAGTTASYDAEFMITRLDANEVLVESADPIMVNAQDFNFGPAIDKLQELAKLDSITPVVPVSFSLVFKR
ncbi:MAG: YceI family protein [Litorimonas sp.]